MSNSAQINAASLEGASLILGVALIYLLVRNLPRLLAGRGTLLSPQAARDLLAEEGALPIDVRNPGEFRTSGGRIPGSVNIPLNQMRRHTAEFARERPLILICQSENRAAIAARLLKRAGFRKVYILEKGIPGWEEAGYPVE